MCFKIIALVNVCAAFSLQCPEPAHWTYRAKGHCADPSKYLCLRNDFINGYSENCSRSHFQQPGEKAILRGGIYSDICSVERYQPFPIKFYTNTSTNCTFLRSFCREEGQVLYDQGNRTTDASCRCDHRQGYDFLIKPNNQCFCKPSQEDCSCYLKICQNSIHILSSDYKCIYKTDLQKVTPCRSIKDESDNIDIKIDITGNIHKEDNINFTSKHVSSMQPGKIMAIIIIVVLSTCFIIGTVFTVLFVLKIGRNSVRDYIHGLCSGHEATLVDPTNNSLVKAQSENQLLNQGQDKKETYTKPIVENTHQPTESRTTESSEKTALPKRPPPPSRPLCLQSEDKNEAYTKPIVENKRHQPESRTTESSEKSALPKRPPPPSRPSCPQSEEQTQIRNDEDIQQKASLYGIREENEIRLVMVGRTGSGKSATGNTIMAKADHFESKLAGGSVTRECKRGECSKAGRKIVLVDTPGIFDTKLPFEQISKEIVRCVNMSTPGPHAFLLVLQIARFTDEEIETFNRLFDLFGAEMGKFAIITFTKLDDLESEKNTIETYIEMAPEKLKEFLNRCNGRFIAIDNKASKKSKSAKIKTLIHLVDSIVKQNGGQCYTNGMYKEAEAALQRKVKKVEEERAQEKKKEIEQIQSTFAHKMNAITDENNKLAQQVRSNKETQRKVKMEKDKAQHDFQKMVDEMKKIDKKHNQELYQIKKKEKEDKEKQAKILEEKEKQQMQFMHSMEQRQMDMDNKYQDMKRQKELQLSKVTEDHNKRMAAEMQRIIDGNNLKYNEMMKAMEEKNKANAKLQQKMAQQNTSMNEMMRERDMEFHKLQEEHRKRMEEEKDRANETHKKQLEEQKQSIEATKNAILQQQIEMDNRNRNDQQEANKRDYNKLQEQLAQQNEIMQNMRRERDFQMQEQEDKHRKQIQDQKERANEISRRLQEKHKCLEVKTELIRREQIERDDQRQREERRERMRLEEENRELKRREEILQERVNQGKCVPS